MPQRIEAEVGPIEIHIKTGWDGKPQDPVQPDSDDVPVSDAP